MSKKLTVSCVLVVCGLVVNGCWMPLPGGKKKNDDAKGAPSGVTTTTSGSADAFAGACKNDKWGSCREYLGTMRAGTEDACTMLNGTFSKTERCPADTLGAKPLAARCTIKPEGDDRTEKVFFYADDKNDLKSRAASAEVTCGLDKGTFETAAAKPVVAKKK